MSSCPSSSDSNKPLTEEQAEEFRKNRYEAVKKDFKQIVLDGALMYMTNKDFLADFAFKVDRKSAITEAIEEAAKELKELKI